MAGDDVEIRIVGKDEASGPIHAIRGALSGMLEVAGGLLAVEGIKKLTEGIQDGLKAAEASQIIEAQTAAAIKSTGDASGQSAEQIRSYASSLEGASTFSRDTIQQGENMLLTFTNIGGKTFPEATQAVTDMTASFQAAGKGMNISDIAIMVGKALNDPEKGMAALHRVGVAFTDDQKKVVAEMMKTGDVAGAQAVILGELNREFGGSAAAQAGTYAGQLAIVKNRFEDMKIAVGEALIPVLARLATAVLPLVSAAMEKIPAFVERITPALQNLAAIAVQAFQTGFGFVTSTVVPAVQRLATTLQGPVHAAFVLVRDAVITFVQALSGNWTDSSKIEGFHRVIGNLGLFIAGTIVPAVQQLATLFMSTLLPAIQRLATFIGANLNVVLPILAGLFLVLLGPIALISAAVVALALAWQTNFLNIQGIVASVWGFIQPVLEAIRANLEAFAADTLPKLIAAWQNVQAAVSAAVQAIEPIIRAVFEAIVSFIQAHGEQIKAILTGAWDVIKGIVQVDVALIEGIIKTALDIISGNWSGAWNDIKEMLRGIWAGIEEAVQGGMTIVQNEIQIGIDAIKGVFAGAAGWLVQAGRDLVMGLVSGIRGAIGAAANEAANLAKSVLDAAKNALGIHSPSAEMQAIGEQTGQGFVVGLSSTASQIASAAIAAVMGGKTAMDSVIAQMTTDVLAKLTDLQMQLQAKIDVTQALGGKNVDKKLGPLQAQLDAAGAIISAWSAKTGQTVADALAGSQTEQQMVSSWTNILSTVLGSAGGLKQYQDAAAQAADAYRLGLERHLPDAVLIALKEAADKAKADADNAGKIVAQATADHIMADPAIAAAGQTMAGVIGKILANPSSLTQYQDAARQTAHAYQVGLEFGLPAAALQALKQAADQAKLEADDAGQVFAKGTTDGFIKGIVKLTDAQLKSLKTFITNAADSGTSMVDSILQAIEAGRLTMTQAASDFTQPMIDQLKVLQQQAGEQLQQAFLTGTDPTQIEKNLDIINALLKQLATTAQTVATSISGPTGVVASTVTAVANVASAAVGAMISVGTAASALMTDAANQLAATFFPDISHDLGFGGARLTNPDGSPLDSFQSYLAQEALQYWQNIHTARITTGLAPHPKGGGHIQNNIYLDGQLITGSVNRHNYVAAASRINPIG